MHWLLVCHTVYFNRRHRSSGHLFQGRYRSFLVQEGDYLLGSSRYVHLNPARGVSVGEALPSIGENACESLNGVIAADMQVWVRRCLLCKSRWCWASCAGEGKQSVCVIGVSLNQSNRLLFLNAIESGTILIVMAQTHIQKRTFAEQLNTWMQIAGILIAAVWGVYTFVFKEITTPKAAP